MKCPAFENRSLNQQCVNDVLHFFCIIKVLKVGAIIFYFIIITKNVRNLIGWEERRLCYISYFTCKNIRPHFKKRSGKRKKKKNTQKRKQYIFSSSDSSQEWENRKTACLILLRCFAWLVMLCLEEICYVFIRIIHVIVTFYCFIERTRSCFNFFFSPPLCFTDCLFTFF